MLIQPPATDPRIEEGEEPEWQSRVIQFYVGTSIAIATVAIVTFSIIQWLHA